MKEADVILTPIPQADGHVKNRPAIILCEMPSYGDLLVCGVSTQLDHYVQGFNRAHGGLFRDLLTELAPAVQSDPRRPQGMDCAGYGPYTRAASAWSLNMSEDNDEVYRDT